MKIRTRFRSAFSATAFVALAFVVLVTSSVVHAELPQASTPIRRAVQLVAASADASTSPARVAERNVEAESRLAPLSSPITPVPPAAFGDQKPAVTKSGATPSNLAPVLLPAEPSMISRLARLARALPANVPLMDSNGTAGQTKSHAPKRRRTLDQLIRASGWSGGVIGRAVKPIRKAGDPDPEVDPLPPLATPPTGLDADAPLEP